MALGALIALKPLEIQKHLFYEKIVEVWQRTHTRTKKSGLLLCFMSKIGFCQKNWQFSICGVSKVDKKCSNCKNKVTFTNKFFYGPGMKVTLFLRFGEIVMLKMAYKDSQL